MYFRCDTRFVKVEKNIRQKVDSNSGRSRQKDYGMHFTIYTTGANY